MKRTIQASAIAITLAGFAMPATADLISYNGLALHETVDYRLEGNAQSARAGQMLVTFNNEEFVAFCVDLRHTIKKAWYIDVEPVTFVGDGGRYAAFLYDHFAHTVTTNLQAASLQVAIWEAVEDWNDIDLFDGDFKLREEPDIAGVAQGFLDALPADLSDYVPRSFIVKSGNEPRSQHLIVPEPATLLSIAIGLPLLGLRRRYAA